MVNAHPIHRQDIRTMEEIAVAEPIAAVSEILTGSCACAVQIWPTTLMNPHRLPKNRCALSNVYAVHYLWACLIIKAQNDGRDGRPQVRLKLQCITN